jgi:hypothetical protein
MTDIAHLLDDEIVFEQPSSPAAADLAWRLRHRPVWTLDADEGSYVGVTLGTNDLASLLRDVEAWVESRDLGGICFMLDGRTYVLQAAENSWASFA